MKREDGDARARRANAACLRARAARALSSPHGDDGRYGDARKRDAMAIHDEQKRVWEEKFRSEAYDPTPSNLAYRYEPPDLARKEVFASDVPIDTAYGVEEDVENRRGSSSEADTSEQTKIAVLRGTGERTPPPVNSASRGRTLCELYPHQRARKGDTSTLQTFYSVLRDKVTPEELLRGEDERWWREFENQGAMVIKIEDGWDLLDDASALCDLSWIGTKKLKLSTLGPDYQYIRQNLPDSKTGLLQPFRAMDDHDRDGEVGAFVEDFQERTRTHADQFRLMDVDAREAWFLQQVHSGFPLQFPYLQGISIEALLKNVRQVDPNETTQRHAWDPRFLGTREPSILKKCLQLCEASHHWRRGVSDVRPPPREQSSDLYNNVIKQTVDEAREEERKFTGGEVTRLPSAVMQRRVERRESKKKGKRHSSLGVSLESNPDVLKMVEAQSDKKLWGVGIITPWLYYMGVGSVFPMHFEDYAFASANVLLERPESQSAVVWYSIPRSDLYLVHTYLRETLGDEYSVDILEMRRLWLDPVRIEQWNKKRASKDGRIRVYRHVQRAGDYVVSDYGSIHWGVNLGDGWKAAVNFAYVDWKPAAEEVNEVYRRLEEETGMSRHHRCCPKFHELDDFFSAELLTQPSAFAQTDTGR
ncbi:hypothetical protein BE221DRAFT_194930 [Ostreococcus tauri]|uniref:JmjC domain-containing protein n=2 Tax=Ostreococcus tauri TaxID=70448 RepID=A0A1Y5I5K4_OSTTA|nr:hypothetical protein BE221DRAFT_194930 [Ostreococcus tauri]